MYLNGDVKILEKWKQTKLSKFVRFLTPVPTGHSTRLASGYGMGLGLLVFVLPIVLLIPDLNERLSPFWALMFIAYVFTTVAMTTFLVIASHEPMSDYSSLTPGERAGMKELRRTRDQRMKKVNK